MTHGKKPLDPSARLLLTPQPQFVDGARLFAVRRLIIPQPFFAVRQHQLCFVHWAKPIEIYRDCTEAEWEFWREQGIPSLGDVNDAP